MARVPSFQVGCCGFESRLPFQAALDAVGMCHRIFTPGYAGVRFPHAVRCRGGATSPATQISLWYHVPMRTCSWDDCDEPLLKHQKKYCSRECMGAGHSKERTSEKLLLWLEQGASASNNDGVLAKWARRYLIEEAGERCTRCGWGEVSPSLGYPILTIDHVDGNWRNNVRDNLVVLCYNCHTLTPTFGSQNSGIPKGRPGTRNRVRSKQATME